MTKLFPLALLATLAVAGAASAENTFGLDRAHSSASNLALTNVQADQPGTLEVFAFDGDKATRFLGSAPIAAGTTDAVEVSLNEPSNGRVLVILSNGNYSVATLDVRDVPTN